MQLSGVHILLTYQCTLECEHCFVWGSPRQQGTFTLARLEQLLQQAKDAGAEWIYFEGGEPFLFYAVFVEGVKIAAGMGFKVGAVSNAYWATSQADAIEWLKPLTALSDLSISSDLYHAETRVSEQAAHAMEAARWLQIPATLLTVAQTGADTDEDGQVMFRGRAAARLAGNAAARPWTEFNTCPYEDLRDPGRVHVDALGWVHICQGLVLGNVFETPLAELCSSYIPEDHAICASLLAGGPAALVRDFDLPHAEFYADACHLCYEARTSLRRRFPSLLAPDQVYGVGL